MTQVTLTFVKSTERVSAKTNKPFTSLSIKTKEHGDTYLSGFGNKANKDWKAGDVVEIEVKEVEKDGKKYLNFDMPKKDSAVEEKLEMILNRLVGLKIDMETIKANTAPRARAAEVSALSPVDESVPEDTTDWEPDPDSIPF